MSHLSENMGLVGQQHGVSGTHIKYTSIHEISTQKYIKMQLFNLNLLDQPFN